MSEKTKFWVLLGLLIASVVLVYILNSSYNRILQ
jgi:hypothetical protein